MDIPSDIEWLEPWERITDHEVARSLEAELEKELGSDHHLFRLSTRAIARRNDCDDVLFLTEHSDWQLAVVHLTWRGRTEPDPNWPSIEFFDGWDDWKCRQLEPDRDEPTRGGE